MTAPYHQSEADQAIDIIDLADLEAAARQIIPEGGFGYISGGSEDEWTLRQNTLAFNHRQIVPRMLADIEQPDLSTEFLGIALKTPIMMAPCAAQGLAHVRSEMATAEGVAAAGALMAQSTYSSTSIAQTAAAAPGAPQLFQLYLSKDWDFNHYLLDEAVKAGARAIIMTVDSTLGGYREADLRTRFKFPLPMANLVQFSGGDGTGKNIAEIYAQAAQRIGRAMCRRWPPTPGCRSSSRASSAETTPSWPWAPAPRRCTCPTTAGASSTAGRLRSTCCPKWRAPSTARCPSSSTAAFATARTPSRRWPRGPTWWRWHAPSCTAWPWAGRRACAPSSST